MNKNVVVHGVVVYKEDHNHETGEGIYLKLASIEADVACWYKGGAGVWTGMKIDDPETIRLDTQLKADFGVKK